MKLIEQPQSYSDILHRVFFTTLCVGVICTVLLGSASPEVKRVLDSVATDVDFGPVKSLKFLYVAIPLLLALLSRVIKLHDRISDVLGLRRVIDTEWILFPLAAGAGIAVSQEVRETLRRDASYRTQVMYRVFYPYVSLPDARIDRQLVRSALDNLGWLWW